VPFPSVLDAQGVEQNKARFGGVTPKFDPTTYTCTVYCHGASLGAAGGGALTSPDWRTPFPTGSTCGNCHGNPPPAPHPQNVTDCTLCHPDPSGATHMNGKVDGGGGHVAGYADPTSSAFHGPDAIALLVALNNGQTPSLDCRTCHGANLDGVNGLGGPSCSGCHSNPAGSLGSATLANLDPAFQNGVADWRANCTFCHGKPTSDPYPTAANPVNAAPPRGVGGQTAATDSHVGAHQRHLATGTMASPFVCATCHTVPTDLTHLDGTAEVTLQGAGQASLPSSLGTYNATPQTCAVYCHNPSNVSGQTSPAWTAATTSGLACNACHGAPPSSGHHALHVNAGFGCGYCHNATASTAKTPAITNPTKHVDGNVDVVLSISGATWNGTGCSVSACHGTTSIYTW
jgi:predicted CxxxxCH...CXXCH cytochrome family protein